MKQSSDGVFFGFRGAFVLASAVLSSVALMVGSASASPRPPVLPWPELGIVHTEKFDEPFYQPGGQIDSSIWGESWSGYCLNRLNSTVSPYAVPMVSSNSVWIGPAQGALRVWIKPAWSSLSTGQGSGPGGLARILTLVSTGGNENAVWWSLVVSGDGNEIHLVSQSDAGAGVGLSAAISWNAGDWVLVTLGYSVTNCALYLNDQLAATGNGLPVVPLEMAPLTRLILGSGVDGQQTARAQFEEFAAFNGDNRFRQLRGQVFGLSPDRDIAGYHVSFSPKAALGPITPQEEAARLEKLAANKTKLQAASRSTLLATSLAVGTLSADAGDGTDSMQGLASCITGGPVYMTNFISNFGGVASQMAFDVSGGTNGLLYDIFSTPVLVGGQSITDSPWVWLGRTTTCNTVVLTNQTSSMALFILGTPQDVDNDGISDAYCRLILKIVPPLGYVPSHDGYGTPDAWYLQHGLNPMTPGIGDLDADGDGTSNRQEFLGGSDPLVPDSFLLWVSSPSTFIGIP